MQVSVSALAGNDKKQAKSVWRDGGNFDSEEDLLKRGAIVLSVPHTRYHGDGEDAFSRGT